MKNSRKKLSFHFKSIRQQLPKLLFLLLWLPFYSCNDKDSISHDPTLPIKVSDVIPDSGTVAIPLVIHGSNFGTDKSRIKVLFDDREAVIITAQNEHLYVLNPKQSDGHHTIKVMVDDQSGSLTDKPFRYIVSSSVTTVAGTGECDYVDGMALEAKFGAPRYLDVDDRGNILVSDYDDWLRLVSIEDNKVTTLLDAQGQVYQGCFTPDYSYYYLSAEDNPIFSREFYREGNWSQSALYDDGTSGEYVSSITLNDNNELFMVGYYTQFLKINLLTHKITILLEELPEEMGMSKQRAFMTFNPKDKYIYITSPTKHAIYRIDSRKETYTAEDIEVYAGNSNASGFNNGPVEVATFKNPRGIVFDSEGNMFVADYNNNAIRKITPEGMVSTYCGGTAGHKDGVIKEAMFNGPSDLAITPDDIIYVADLRNYRIRCVTVQ